MTRRHSLNNKIGLNEERNFLTEIEYNTSIDTFNKTKIKPGYKNNKNELPTPPCHSITSNNSRNVCVFDTNSMSMSANSLESVNSLQPPLEITDFDQNIVSSIGSNDDIRNIKLYKKEFLSRSYDDNNDNVNDDKNNNGDNSNDNNDNNDNNNNENKSNDYDDDSNDYSDNKNVFNVIDFQNNCEKNDTKEKTNISCIVPAPRVRSTPKTVEKKLKIIEPPPKNGNKKSTKNITKKKVI